MSIVQVSRESLTLRIIATFRAVGGDEDALNRASGAVVIAQQKLTHQWSVRVVLDRGRKGDTGVHRDVPRRAAEAEAVDECQSDGHVDGIDRLDRVMNLGIVDVAFLGS